jgi:hypothetical protein
MDTICGEGRREKENKRRRGEGAALTVLLWGRETKTEGSKSIAYHRQ